MGMFHVDAFGIWNKSRYHSSNISSTTIHILFKCCIEESV